MSSGPAGEVERKARTAHSTSTNYTGAYTAFGVLSEAMRIVRAAVAPQRRRLVAGVVFALITVTACFLVGQRLTHSSWPLGERERVCSSHCCRLLLLRELCPARARLAQAVPRDQRPDQARCLASVGAAAASGAVLPFRLDYVIKVGTLRRLGGIRIGLEAIALSIISLGMVDAVAMLPLSISATATSFVELARPAVHRRHIRDRLLRLVFREHSTGAPAATPAQPPPAHRRRARLRAQNTARPAQGATVAGAYLFLCWTTRAVGSALLLSALWLVLLADDALCVLCLSAAAGVGTHHGGGRSRRTWVQLPASSSRSASARTSRSTSRSPLAYCS